MLNYSVLNKNTTNSKNYDTYIGTNLVVQSVTVNGILTSSILTEITLYRLNSITVSLITSSTARLTIN